MLAYFRNKKNVLIALIGTPVLLIPVLHTNSTIDANIHIRFIALSIFLLSLCLFVFLSEGRNGLMENGLNFFLKDQIFILFFLYALASLPGCFLSPFSNGDSIFEWLKIILLPLLVLIMSLVFRDHRTFLKDLSKSVTLLLVLILFYGAYEFLKVALYIPVSHYSLYAVKTTFAHKNIFSEMLFMMLPFALYSFLTLKDIWKWTGFFCAVLAVIFIIGLMTRAVWLALFFSGTAVLILYLFSKAGEKTIEINMKKAVLFVLSGAVLMMAILGIAAFFYFHKESSFTKQIVAIFNFEHGSAKERIVLWKNSLKIFIEHPFFGVGLGNWKIEIMKYGTSGLVSENNTTFYQRPHNDLIWILAEQGFFAFVLYLALAGNIFYSIVKIIKHSMIREERIFFYLMFFAFTGYCVFSLFSFPKERAEHLLFLSFIFTAVVIFKQKLFPSEKINRQFSFAFFILTVVIGSFSLIVSTVRMRSEQDQLEAFKARQQNDWKTMIDDLDRAESFFYRVDAVSTPLSWYRGLGDFNLNKMQDAFYDFKRAYSYNPYHIHVLNNLGTCYEMAGNHAEAMHYFEKAIELSPTFEDAKMNLIAAQYNAGEVKKAYEGLRNNKFEHSQDKYNQFLNLALVSVINLTRDTLDADGKNDFDRILNTKGWLNIIHDKSLKENRSLEKQFLLDLIYSFEIMEKDTLGANNLKNKFSVILKGE